ncbi:hypothetical protein G6F49_011971 [Rhizopus delemar]|uniref:Uncharacterized protein n=1 Tax=Rhizopus delemar (strain RA 99-880 / ATCC MYA-4621 / FGSC 9543 / NRRL 43880) TaxID=246409 RepID=I1CNR0_RHIO9|nr:hypothetical protein RO3G_14788 [Rhizopus delemar RA 99-880]EIE90090.1 hypothetical protein RO3G_14801 [Rhizopus delemar RA 99-880]KAG1143367.1 hypothetical protein G6F36_015431 [Rhizopus arrhizus]KAG1541077.1 hypothetical protein G6F49_011971 [Rhizopus delemar]|eukprot:EIE90077.1 hypothetical protein RO3G_14788 [Rhizopus delemar RA 99-880]
MCENVFLSHLHIKWGAPSVSGITPFTLVIPKTVQALTHHQEHRGFETAYPLRIILTNSRRLVTEISAFPGQVAQAPTPQPERPRFETAFPLRTILAMGRRLITEISVFHRQVA